jgi:hypothetical protein
MLELLASHADKVRLFMLVMAAVALAVVFAAGWATRSAWRSLLRRRALPAIGFLSVVIALVGALYILWVIAVLAVGFSKQ